MVGRHRKKTEKLELRQEEGVSDQDLGLCLARDSPCQAKFNLIIQGPPEREEQSPENNFSHGPKKGVYKTGGHKKPILTYLFAFLLSWLCEMKIMTWYLCFLFLIKL